MTTVYFVRHALPQDGIEDNAKRCLTEQGMKDRELVTEYLKDKGVTAVLSSSYLRATQTVEHLADALGLQVETNPDFRERVIYPGHRIPDFFDYAAQQWADHSYRLPGGESLCDVQTRNIKALEEVLDRYNGKTVVIGSHGTALCSVINYYVPAFGYDDFMKLIFLRPWIEKFTFDGKVCTGVEMYDVFTKQTLVRK